MPEAERSGLDSDIDIDVPENLEELIEGELITLYYALLAYKGQHHAMDRVSRLMVERGLL